MTRLHRIAITALLGALAGCSSLLGPKQSPTIFAPENTAIADPSWPTVTWPLGTVPPTSAQILGGSRIAVSPVPGELQVYKSALWARTPPEMLEETVLRLLEDSGKIPAVARQGSGIRAEYRLIMDIRHFEADYAGGALPSAVVEVNAKLLHVTDQSVIASRTFRHAQPAAGIEVARVAQAVGVALGVISRDIAGWALVTGDEYHRKAHH